MSQQQLETLFEFPCSFPIKVMAEQGAPLQDIVSQALTDVGIDASRVQMQTRASSSGRYLSITAIFTAESKEQLDRLYQLLTAHPEIKMVL